MSQKTFLIAFTALTITGALVTYHITPKKRYAIFAGYNPDGNISPYVITYLKGLEEVSDGIIYITDSNLNKGEEEKLKSLKIIYQQHIPHNEYDWGSYKRGYNFLKQTKLIKNTKELILANDSCIAPLTSFVPMFKEMEKQKDIDFWGNTQDRPYYPHIQSYFMVLRRSALTSPVFENLITGVTHQKQYFDYVSKYEILLTTRLKNEGLKATSYIPMRPKTDIYSTPHLYISEYNNQFIKKKSITEKTRLKNISLTNLLNKVKSISPKTYQNIIALTDKNS
ncbi:MAG: hypothetical protein IKW39_03925 [Alphaproteobacteria bacterium]|nr:hypothetical protein [Alphaproteobacteria bacterium]